MFNVTLLFTANGKRRSWTGTVASIAGESIFQTAARAYARKAKRGVPALIPGRSTFTVA